MRESLVTPPAVEPVTLAEAKLHLRVDSSDEDSLITALVVAARRECERRQHRALVTQTWDFVMDQWPGRAARPQGRLLEVGPLGAWAAWPIAQLYDAIELPRPPLQSIASITYVDVAGSSQTLAPSAYQVSAGTPGRVAPAYGTSWPTARAVMDAVTIRAVCGYGDASTVPRTTKQAILLIVGHLYEDRESVVVNVGANIAELPQGIDALLADDAWGKYV